MTLGELIGRLTDLLGALDVDSDTEVRIDCPHDTTGFSIDDIVKDPPLAAGIRGCIFLASDDLDRCFDPPAGFNP